MNARLSFGIRRSASSVFFVLLLMVAGEVKGEVNWAFTSEAQDTGAISEVDIAPGDFPISREYPAGFVSAVRNANTYLHLSLWSVSKYDLSILRRSPNNHFQWGSDVSSPEIVNLDYDRDGWSESIVAVIDSRGYVRLMSFETTPSGVFYLQDTLFLGQGVDVEIALGGDPGVSPVRADTVWALVQYNDTDCDMFLVRSDLQGDLSIESHETGVLD